MAGLCELRESTVPVSVVPIKPQFPAKELAIPISVFGSDNDGAAIGEARAAVKPTELKYSSKVAAGLAVCAVAKMLTNRHRDRKSLEFFMRV